MAWSDLSSGMFGALGVIAGLVQRGATGHGTEVDVAMSDTLAVLALAWLGPLLNGAAPMKLEFPGYGCYECADGKWLCLSVTFEDHFWKPLAELTGLGAYAGLNIWQRGEKFPEIDAELKKAMLTKPSDVWSALFDEKDIPWAPVLTPEQAIHDPHFRARELFVEREDGGKSRWYVAQPLKFDGQTLGPTGPSPELGDTDPESIWT
jgi:crotonobetainyl-CoA:carnitine CoA-transferase CaiB-like acyl-CoA transferase